MADTDLRQYLRQAEANPNPADNATAAARRRRAGVAETDVPDWMLNPIGWVFYFAYRTGSMVEFQYTPPNHNQARRYFVGSSEFTEMALDELQHTPGYFKNEGIVAPIWFPAEPAELYWGYRKPSERTANQYSFDLGPKSLDGIAGRFGITAEDVYLANKDFLDDLARYDSRYMTEDSTPECPFQNWTRALPTYLKNRSMWIPPRRHYSVLTLLQKMGNQSHIVVDLNEIAEARLLSRRKGRWV